MREETRTQDAAHRVHHDGAYSFEHYLSWFLGLGAIILGVIGALIAFDVISVRTINIQGTDVTGVRGTGNEVFNFQDGMLFLLPSIALAFLAMTFHATEHHMRISEWREKLWSAEHGVAYLGLIATLGLGAAGFLVGFDVLDEGWTWRSGVTWHMLSILSGVLTATMHTVGHHQYVYDEDDIRVMVEDRLSRTAERPATVVRGRGVEER
jgi:hypothetical protein